jgi:hypothetical protein
MGEIVNAKENSRNYLMTEGLTDTLKKGEDDDPSRPRILLQGARK